MKKLLLLPLLFLSFAQAEIITDIDEQSDIPDYELLLINHKLNQIFDDWENKANSSYQKKMIKLVKVQLDNYRNLKCSITNEATLYEDGGDSNICLIKATEEMVSILTNEVIMNPFQFVELAIKLMTTKGIS